MVGCAFFLLLVLLSAFSLLPPKQTTLCLEFWTPWPESREILNGFLYSPLETLTPFPLCMGAGGWGQPGS